jgi:ribonuclease J
MNSLKFIAISGTTSVTENCYVYEYDNDMILVDCGVGFPEPEMFGVDLVIPDFTYIKENAHKLKGILITHGHEDHLGALPFLLKDLPEQAKKVPIYSTKLVAGFIEDKFSDHGMKPPKVNIFDPERDTVGVGVFRVTPFRVSHSVPDSVGFCIDTPEGKFFHVPDYKFDWTPVDGRPFDVNKAAILASDGVVCVASDCLGSTSPGFTESEKEIEHKIESIFQKASGRIYFTTISSNISRMQQALNVAKRLNRSVCFIGRSIDRKAEIAKRLGYLHYPSNLVVTLKQASRMPKNKVVYIISGSYGQPGSALYRVAIGEHNTLKVEPEDTVVFSSDPAPPGSKGNVDFVVDRLFEIGVEVHYYDIQEDLHVSGHGCIEDIKMLLGILKPKYCIPIGGTIRHMRAFNSIAQDMKVEKGNVLELRAGDVVEFKQKEAKKTGHIQVKGVLVDGLGIGDVGNVVLRDRHILAKDGIAITLIQMDSQTGKLIADPEIISRGFVFDAKQKGLLLTAGKRLRIFLDRKIKLDKKLARDEGIDFLEKLFFEETGRRPMILPLIVEL